MHHPALRVTPKDSYYRIQEPHSRLCIRLRGTPSCADAAPKVKAQLVPGSIACWWRTREQAEAVLARYLANEPLEIVRVDA